MTEHEAQLKDIDAGKKRNVNAIYKRYRNWHAENHKDKRPLTFKEWLGWAQKKGIAEKYGFTEQDAPETSGNEERVTDTSEQKTDVQKTMSKSGKIAGAVIISIASIFVIGALVGGGK